MQKIPYIFRPETAQGIFVNFKNVQRTSQQRKFRLVLVRLVSHSVMRLHRVTLHSVPVSLNRWNLNFSASRERIWSGLHYWRQFCIDWLQSLGIKEDEMRARDHSPEELCFYSKGTTDLEFLFPFGWGELWGIADRTDYDLTQHQNTSGEPM